VKDCAYKHEYSAPPQGFNRSILAGVWSESGSSCNNVFDRRDQKAHSQPLVLGSAPVEHETVRSGGFSGSLAPSLTMKLLHEPVAHGLAIKLFRYVKDKIKVYRNLD
jgi:hypothetical protein